MCSGIVIYLKDVTSDNLNLVEDVFIQSSIRGLHATGVSYLKNNKIHTVIEPVSALEFIDKHDIEKFINEDGHLVMVGHCRYSTSDLNYNQPMFNKNVSIVHNGVITQEPPESWKSLYGYSCKTKNDSELVLKSIENGKEPLAEWSDSSMSVCELHQNGQIRFYRNHKRPLSYANLNNGYIVASTEDILQRSRKHINDFRFIIDCEQNTIYTTSYGYMGLTIDKISTNKKDLQYAL